MSVLEHFAEIPHQIENCLLCDRFRFRKRLKTIKKDHKNGKKIDDRLTHLSRDIEQSVARIAKRQANIPTIKFPEMLPVSGRRDEIAKLINDHQVIILCGETGSGKTTQLPKICLTIGRGVKGQIAHTQPRRLAARSVAARIAEELESPLGKLVGYKIRFSDHTDPDSSVKLLTDGMLLAEIHSDPYLYQYDTIIIDEAHERSLNIDFLLGFFKQLLPKRPDLKLIITSATIDPERFSQHFNDAPIIMVTGRTYPVDIRYQPIQVDKDEADDGVADNAMINGILKAVDEVCQYGVGDILIFLAGERDIRETSEALRKHHPPQTEILPLFSRLSASDQQKAFKQHKGRRIILATNVAETSITVPGIRYVIDPGLARISRYSYRNKVQRLPIERISQASANQRAGRCGRVSAGICIRLYDEADYLAKPEFTTPEIRRTNLASVILQMKVLGLGDIEFFPFVEPPDQRFITDGYKLLHELGAMNLQQELTKTGRRLARMSIDPRLARMVIAATQNNCLDEILVIVSALSIQDPRERPMAQRAKADERHREYEDEQSDFLAFVNLWRVYQKCYKDLSGSQFRKYCKQNFLSYMRLREWRELYVQLKAQVLEMGYKLNQVPPEYPEIHKALLAGLLGNIAFKDEGPRYLGARNTKLYLFPGSSLIKKTPKWMMAAEWVETSRLYARMAARIEPEWIEPLAGELVKRSYYEAHWEKKRAQVVAYERTMLYGLLINPKRRVNYGRINPVEAHDIFIRSALVEGDYLTRAKSLIHNNELIAVIESLEDKSRRQDILVDREIMFDFYRQRIPDTIIDGVSFEAWREEKEKEDPDYLLMNRDMLMRHEAQSINVEQFPESMKVDGMSLALHYHFEPNHMDDGVSVDIPFSVLNQLSSAPFDYLVPGLLVDKLSALIKGLPKRLRKQFVPVSNCVDDCLTQLTDRHVPILDALTQALNQRGSLMIAKDEWRLDKLPAHLMMNFRVIDVDKVVLAKGRDLLLLQKELREDKQIAPAVPVEAYEQAEFDVDALNDIPTGILIKHQQLELKRYPALVAEQGHVALRLFDTEIEAKATMITGFCQLFSLREFKRVKALEKRIGSFEEMAFHFVSIGTRAELIDSIKRAIIRHVLINDQEVAHDAKGMELAIKMAAADLLSAANRYCELMTRVLAAYSQVSKILGSKLPDAWLVVTDDIKLQLSHLVDKDFINTTPYQQIIHYPRYLKAILLRLEKMGKDPARQIELTTQISAYWQRYLKWKNQLEVQGVTDARLDTFRWMIEELRVSLFAQELKTPMPISPKRLDKFLEKC